MKSKIATLCICIGIIVQTSAQETETIFKVLASKGANKYQPTGSAEVKPLVVGKKLMKGDKIVIDENGYAGLAFQSGKTIEIKKSGTYEINKLIPEVTSQNSGIGKKYIEFVVGEMTANSEDMTKNRHKYMAVTGSVERGSYDINLLVPHGKMETHVFSQPTAVKWEAVPGVATYTIRVDNMFDEHAFSTATPDTSIFLDFAKVNPKKEAAQYILRISAKSKNKELHAQDFSIKFLGSEKEGKLLEKLTELKSELGEESALNHMVLASFYEEHKLYLNAMESYHAAITMQPDVEDFKALYHQFLIRSGAIK